MRKDRGWLPPPKNTNENTSPKRISFAEFKCQQKGEVDFHSCFKCPSRQEEIRGERWQPEEGRAKKGDRSSYHTVGQGHVDLHGWTGLNLSYHAPCNRAAQQARTSQPQEAVQCVGIKAEGGLPDLTNRNIGHPVCYLATLNGGRRA